MALKAGPFGSLLGSGLLEQELLLSSAFLGEGVNKTKLVPQAFFFSLLAAKLPLFSPRFSRQV